MINKHSVIQSFDTIGWMRDKTVNNRAIVQRSKTVEILSTAV